MAPSKNTSDNHHRSSSKDSDDEVEPSHNLWIGNLSSDTVDSDLMALFAKYGALDSVTTYASRNYAFVYFKHLDEAKFAKDALQGELVRGNPVRIEFARPAKPGKHVWIGGISLSVTKEQLENEFSKFGKIEDYKFLRDRNSALIDYYKIEDAVAALKNMNGKRIGGEQIRVDYLRSQPSRRDLFDHNESRDGHFGNKRGGPPDSLWMPPDAMRGFPETSHGHKRPPTSGGRREGQPSKVLWIGYPPSVHLDEQMLHNSMILFGEIERIKSFPSRHYSFVEFRSIDEARRAKEGLQGRLFNDPRIQILFSNSELAPTKDNPPFFTGLRGPIPDIFFNELPFGPMDLFGPSRLMAPNNFPGPIPPNGMPGPNMLMRPFAPQGFDPIHGGLESFNDGLVHNYPDGNLSSPMTMNWRRFSPPAPGMFHPAPGMRPPVRSLPGAWDGIDTREMKRSRIDGLAPIDDASFHRRRMDAQGIESPFEFHQLDRGASVQSHRSPVGVDGPSAGTPDSDHCWRGVIAKGGTPVCHARCVPMGNGIDSPFPEIINCSARTGLDMLTKHYAEAIGFDIVFFLPDSEEDFSSYTEFLHYLGGKDRAGVAKLDDGTTLFLVPPSDFLTKVLNVSGPERLYGVVLKLPQQSASTAVQQPQLAIPLLTSQFIDRQQLPPLQSSYSMVPQNEEQALKMDYGRALPEDLVPRAGGGRPLVARADELHAAQSVSMDYVSNPPTTSPVEVSLTPDLIATLASLIPTNIQSSATGPVQLPLSSSARPHFPPVTPDKTLPTQGWIHENQAPVSGAHYQEQMSHPSQQLGNQFNNQTPVLSQFLTYTNIANGPDHSAQSILGSTLTQDPGLNVQQAAAGSARQLNNYTIPSQGIQFSAPQSNQLYQLDASFSSHKNYSMEQTTDAAGTFHPPVPQLPKSTTSAAPIQSGSVSQNQIMTLATDKANTEFSTQVQQLQTSLAGSGQGTAEDEADKNQRYQSTLQFAASLLLQIQQQQASAQAAQGSGDQH